MNPSKKSMLEFLINDLENSNDFGTKKAVNNICKTTNKKEILMKKLINLNLFTPNVQKIISSLFSSYFVNTKKDQRIMQMVKF